jgi:hypothetical protein
MLVGDDHLAWWTDSAETAVIVMRELATGRHDLTGAPPWVADSVMWPQHLASALAFRGHLHAAAETDRRLLADPTGVSFTSSDDPFPDLALFGIIPDSSARRQFSAAWGRSADWGVGPLFRPPRHLRGLPWWLSRSDTASLARFGRHAAEIAGGSASYRAVLRGRYFSAAATAYLSLARSDSEQALRQFEAIPEALCMAGGCFFEKFTLARLLIARGDDRHAASVLDRWSWVDGNTPSAVLAVLERGRIAERLGDRNKAVECYQFVANAWRRADPELRVYVEEALAGLTRLSAGAEQ